MAETNRLRITSEKVSFGHFDLKVSFDVAKTAHSPSVSFPIEAFVLPKDEAYSRTLEACYGFLISGMAYVQEMDQPLRKAGRAAAAQLLKKSSINQPGALIFIPKSAGHPVDILKLTPRRAMDDVWAKIPRDLFGEVWRNDDD